MKKIFLALSLILTVAVSSSIASPVSGENPEVVKAFNKQFAGAENVKWSTTDAGVAKVSFTWSDTRAEAYFDSDGELIATIRNILYDQVPMNVMRAVNARFKAPVVISVNEVYSAGSSRYILSLEDAGKKITATISSTGDIVEVKKAKK
jgi:hypothetical protein